MTAPRPPYDVYVQHAKDPAAAAKPRYDLNSADDAAVQVLAQVIDIPTAVRAMARPVDPAQPPLLRHTHDDPAKPPLLRQPAAAPPAAAAPPYVAAAPSAAAVSSPPSPAAVGKFVVGAALYPAGVAPEPLKEMHPESRQHDLDVGVRMPAKDVLEALRVEIGATLKRSGVGGMTMDTASMKAEVVKRGDPAGAAAMFPGEPQDYNDAQRAEVGRWAEKSAIWVCLPQPDPKKARLVEFFSDVCRIDQVHHSSIASGKDVICAGEWIIEKGKLKALSANSGHYQPTMDHLIKAARYLVEAWQPDTTVLLWHKASAAWVDVKIRAFVDDPKQNNTCKVHYNAPD